jgi:adenylate kinase family enzyme
MIIIEGPDGSGKSTYIDKLSKYFNIPVAHSGGPQQSEIEITNRIEDQIEDPNKLVLRDRSPIISERIYGTLLDRNSIMKDDKVFNRYLYHLLSFHPVIIYCRPPNEVLFNMSNHQPGMFDTEEHFHEVNKRQKEIVAKYDEIFNNIPHYKYDYTSTNSNRSNLIINVIKNKINTMLFQDLNSKRKN